jgi:hypothetical protein
LATNRADALARARGLNLFGRNFVSANTTNVATALEADFLSAFLF